jgi:peroxiredoxin
VKRPAGQTLVLAALAALACAPVVRADGVAVFPARVTDVEGAVLDLAALAADGRLYVVTMKAPGCPVCREQLVRLKKLLPRLQSCGARFVVLAPGPAEDLRAIARDTGFPYPFVVDDGLAIARAADLALTADQIQPAILALDPERRIAWVQRGRSGGYFGDDELLEHLGCGALRDARSPTLRTKAA